MHSFGFLSESSRKYLEAIFNAPYGRSDFYLRKLDLLGKYAERYSVSLTDKELEELLSCSWEKFLPTLERIKRRIKSRNYYRAKVAKKLSTKALAVMPAPVVHADSATSDNQPVLV